MGTIRPWVAVFLILVVILGLALAVTFWTYWTLSRPPSVAQNTIVEISLGGVLYEVPPDNPFFQVLEPDKLTLYDLWELLELASRDNRVSSIYLEVQPLAVNWAQIEELRDGMHKFRASGKKIHAFLSLDMVGESEFYLASAADTISINPGAGLLLNGLTAEIQFYKRSLQKLGIKPEFIQFKEFKSPEVYDRESMSAPIRSMLESILADMEARFVRSVAGDRKIEESVLEKIIDLGMVTARQAVESGLVDRAGYRHEVIDELAQEAGQDEYSGMGASEYLSAARSRQPAGGRQVALIGGIGMITAGKSDSFGQTLGGSSMARILRNVRESGKYEAVLFRVDSPGGSAVGSDMVWREVELLEEAGIPVIVSMSGVAGSGGYYISMGASKIISQPSTITGSIGVIFGKFDLGGLYDWLGISTDLVKSSPNADLFSFSASLTSEQREQIIAWMQEIYDAFVSKAAKGRGMEFAKLEKLARGRIYTGEQAREIGLVDDTGGFPKALEHIRQSLELADDARIDLVHLPEPKSFWETLSELGAVRMHQTGLIEEWLRRELPGLETAGPRLFMPEIRID